MKRWLFILLSLLFVPGCGPSVPKGVVVTGKLTKGGAPLAPSTDGTTIPLVTIFSVTKAEDGTSTGGQAATDATGTFRIVAGGRGVPPGKYRMQVSAELEPGTDMFGGAFTGEKFLKEFEVPADKMGGEFDLGTIELDTAQVQSVTPAANPTP